jgi:hypothetical protein
MLMERIRLQRKFNLKNKISPIERLSQIAKMMILFWLSLIFVVCLLNFSFRFHLTHVKQSLLRFLPVSFGQPRASSTQI